MRAINNVIQICKEKLLSEDETRAQLSLSQLNVLISYLEHDVQPIMVLDPDCNVVSENSACRHQFGMLERPYIGKKCYRISHGFDTPFDLAGESRPVQGARETRRPQRTIHVLQTPRGPEHVEVELRPVFDSAGRVLAYVERLSKVSSASAQPSTVGLVGRSPPFIEAVEGIHRVAQSMLPVLLLGESGTGKELFAHAVHMASQRSGSPFVVVDCSGLTETLFESELFGYEKGAFTGAAARKKGLVETARGGTLFLDEIGDVPLAMQVKLLRLLESGTFRRVGGVDLLQSDFRLVAATHRPLESMVAGGQFRQDLYYRISAFPINLPPLRDRIGDIPLLAESILLRGTSDDRPLAVSAGAMAKLQRYRWPGNVRELRNVLERARLFSEGDLIESDSLPAFLDRPYSTEGSDGGRRVRFSEADLRQRLLGFRGTRGELAREIGVSERTLYRRLKELGVE